VIVISMAKKLPYLPKLKSTTIVICDCASDDIYRPAKDGEFPLVPDCRRCKAENPEYYQGCIKKIFPVHGKCHEDIHELEKLLFTNLKKKLWADFLSATNS
jgi:hypothetical protein